jgi:hypothetical protein
MEMEMEEVVLGEREMEMEEVVLGEREMGGSGARGE